MTPTDQLSRLSALGTSAQIAFHGTITQTGRNIRPHAHKTLLLLALGVPFISCGNTLHAQTCIFGTGISGGATCCSSSGCTACFGAKVHASTGPGSASWKEVASPCGCVWQLGGSCPPAAAVRQFVQEEHAQLYQ